MPSPIPHPWPAGLGVASHGATAGLQLRHDHGSPHMSDHFQAEIALLGMGSFPAFVR